MAEGHLTTAIETITPEMASEYLKKNCVNNRKLNKAQVQYYARLLKEGQWVLNGESIIFDDKGNLCDGQHRLNAIILANIPMQTVVVRNVESEAFPTIDKGRGRTTADTLYTKSIPNNAQIAATIRRFLLMKRMNIGSVGTLQKGSGDLACAKISDLDVIKAYEERPQYWQDGFGFAASCYTRCRLFTKSDVAAISAYLHLAKGYNIEFVRDFFSQLFFEELTKNGTLMLLRRILINDMMKPSSKRMTAKYKTQLLVKSWNAFKRHKVYKTLRWIEAEEGEYTFE